MSQYLCSSIFKPLRLRLIFTTCPGLTWWIPLKAVVPGTMVWINWWNKPSSSISRCTSGWANNTLSSEPNTTPLSVCVQYKGLTPNRSRTRYMASSCWSYSANANSPRKCSSVFSNPIRGNKCNIISESDLVWNCAPSAVSSARMRW